MYTCNMTTDLGNVNGTQRQQRLNACCFAVKLDICCKTTKLECYWQVPLSTIDHANNMTQHFGHAKNEHQRESTPAHSDSHVAVSPTTVCNPMFVGLYPVDTLLHHENFLSREVSVDSNHHPNYCASCYIMFSSRASLRRDGSCCQWTFR